MYQTIQLSSCITVQGELVERLHDGRIAIRDGKTVYRGHPVSRREAGVAVLSAVAHSGDHPAASL